MSSLHTQADSTDWEEMIAAEIKELTRMTERKAEISVLDQFSDFIVSRPLPEPSRTLSNTKEIVGYIFGEDLTQDISMLFSMYNRIIKEKLETTILGEYASMKYVDMLYKDYNNSISSKFSNRNMLIIQALDKQLKEFEKKLSDLEFYCETKIEQINQRISDLYASLATIDRPISSSTTVKVSSQHYSRVNQISRQSAIRSQSSLDPQTIINQGHRLTTEARKMKYGLVK